MLIESYYFPTSISQVPSSIGALINLERLAICGATYLTILPNSIGMLKCLTKLDVSDTGIAELLNTIINLKSLKALNMSHSCMQKLPEAIGMLEKLEEIYGVNCNWLETIPGDIVRLPSLKNLVLTKTRVENVPKLPQSLVCLCLSSRASEKAPDISNLVSLRSLELCFTSSTSIGWKTIRGDFCRTMRGSRHVAKETIDIACCKLELSTISSISSYSGCLRYIKRLEIINCKNLRQIGQLPFSLTELMVNNCNLLEVMDLSNLSNFKNLKDLEEWDCPRLVEIQGLDKLESLESLIIGRCSSWLCLPDLSNWKKLKMWDVDALTTYLARGKRVAQTEDLPLSHRLRLRGSANPEY
ncbi:hypothetical protein ACJRO7_014629 [Eucalyptus globulus]|uniref:Disease resistance R13L4/SHOC-2-like LRR domain-containing protein n=1 Tax=Eucalyptus globulus TaxID=34317 RepID=A0ABD3L4L4_EUCGL